MSGNKFKCINIGSYNYLGFAENKGQCHDNSEVATKEMGIATCSSRHEIGDYNIKIILIIYIIMLIFFSGTLQIIERLESLVTEFLDVEAAITVPMGFATNVLNMPTLFDSQCLVLSDEYNHASLILGLKVSGATVKV